MVIWLVAVAVLVFLWLRHRARKARLLAGLTSERPQFMVSPPERRLGPRGDDRW